MQVEKKEQIEFYNRYWSKYEPISLLKLDRIIKILQYLRIVRIWIENPRILDAGCGDGRSVSVWGMNGKATGIDLSTEAMSNARKLYPAFEFNAMDASETNFPDSSFDVVISQEVVEHIENQSHYIKELDRLLSSNGYLILTTPNKYFFDRRKEGNWSHQPIEKLLSIDDIKKLLNPYFELLKLETIICSKAEFGVYKLFHNKFLKYIFKKLWLDSLREKIMLNLKLGAHICILAQKRK